MEYIKGEDFLEPLHSDPALHRPAASDRLAAVSALDIPILKQAKKYAITSARLTR
jgi:hypothetical protein